MQVAAGVLNQPPLNQPGAFQISVQTQGRLANPDEFGQIIVKQSGGAVVRLKDVARVGAGCAGLRREFLSRQSPATGLGMFQRPGSNALATAEKIKATMEQLSKSFPDGLKYDIVYNPTEFIQQSGRRGHRIRSARPSSWSCWWSSCSCRRGAPPSFPSSPSRSRSSAPSSSMAMFGFSLNNLSLFGLVLAIGIVVDDAIVVVENVERNMADGHDRRAMLPTGRWRRWVPR